MAINPPVHRPTRPRPQRGWPALGGGVSVRRAVAAAADRRDRQAIAGELVRHFGYFKHLSEAQADKIARVIRVVPVDAGREIITDGDIGDCTYLLLRGEVEVSKGLYMKSGEGFQEAHKAIVRLRAPEPDRTEQILAPAGIRTISGYFAFGEMASLDPNSRRSATVIATTACTLGELRNADFMALASEDSELGLRVIWEIAKKLSTDLSQANQDVLNLTTAFSFALAL